MSKAAAGAAGGAGAAAETDGKKGKSKRLLGKEKKGESDTYARLSCLGPLP